MCAKSTGEVKMPEKVLPARGDRRTKTGTASSRHHSFQSFSQRIAKLTIDPVRRVRRHDLDSEDLSTTTSYFKNSLEQWRELNMSENFSKFAREVSPLCESLPQLLYFENRIVELLLGYIEKKDTLSLKPLLSLLSHFAHDIGVRFEQYFSRAVTLVTSIAAKHPDVEVIEWSFTCLAWLFKYLSRLLVPDLRPLFDIMAPLLGKEQQKAFVTRFAAEAMSFVVRKAGTVYHKDKSPLDLILIHALGDLQNCAGSKTASQYRDGLMTLFSDAIKGTQRGIHSSGHTIFDRLIGASRSSSIEEKGQAQEAVSGILVSLVHHCDHDTFAPILEVLLRNVGETASSRDSANLTYLARLVAISVTVRKGSRVLDWNPVLSTTIKLLDALPMVRDKHESQRSHQAWQLYILAAEVLQASPMDAAIPFLRPIMDKLTEEQRTELFLPFCNYFAEIGKDRFQSIVLPYFEKFVVNRWSEFGDELGVVILKFSQDGSLVSSRPGGEEFSCPKAWQSSVLTTLQLMASNSLGQKRDQENLSIMQIWRDLRVIESISVDQSVLKAIGKQLHTLVKAGLQTTSPTTELTRFGIGQGFLSYAKIAAKSGECGMSLWPLLCASGSNHTRRAKFLEALLLYLSCLPQDSGMTDTSVKALLDSLIMNLESPSHDLRTLSLRILDAIYSRRGEKSTIFATALLVEGSPLNFHAARSMSMHVRKLAASYPDATQDPWLSKAIPYFFFGLLTVKLSSLWDDACSALKEISATKIGGSIVTDLAFQWLECSPDIAVEVKNDSTTDEPPKRLTAFECSNLTQHRKIARTVAEELRKAAVELRKLYEAEGRPCPLYLSYARSQALRVLCQIPQLAEKRSRQLVPMFLDWASKEELHLAETHDEPEDELQDSEMGVEPTVPEASQQRSRWTRKDQNAMLALFAGFVNPKALYRSSEVYDALLTLLGSGDSNIQKSALKALFTWKSPSIRPYEENLTNILDDARFREEVAIFVQLNEEESKIQWAHRQIVIPVLLRMLYGRSIARKGTASGRRGMEGKRVAVIQALASFPADELREFVWIVLGKLRGLRVVEDGELNEDTLRETQLAVRKQLGFMKMTEDMLNIIGNRLSPHTEELLQAVLFCMVGASRGLSDGNGEEESVRALQYSMLKAIRQAGFKCLNLIFAKCDGFQWDTYMPVIFLELINPRLENLPVETAQSVSGVLQLFATWSASMQTALFLANYNKGLMQRVAECIAVPSAKENVKLFVLGIVKNIIGHVKDGVEGSQSIRERVVHELLQPNIDCFLIRIGGLLKKTPGKAFLEAGVETVSQLAPFVAGSSEAKSLVDISIFLLHQPSRRVSPKTKSDLLRILQHFVPLYDIQDDGVLQVKLFETISSLFGYFKDRNSREVLSQVLTVLADRVLELKEVAELCVDLNSYSATRLDEPDFDRRVKAFHIISEERFKDFTVKQWRPILYNALFYVKDNEELAIRANSSYILRRFIESASTRFDDAQGSSFQDLLSSILVPALRNGAQEPSELVRVEYVGIMAHIVKLFPLWPEVSDMTQLLVGNDEEASFFSNILHIQLHRRLRALRRLAAEAQKGQLKSHNIYQFFIPLIEHFIFDRAEDESAHNLASETVVTISSLAAGLEWPQFRVIFKRFIGHLQGKPELEKIVIRLLGAVIDSLARAAAARADSTDFLVTKDNEGDVEMSADTPSTSTGALAMSIPEMIKLSNELRSTFLPSLMAYLHNKDESTVSLRVPVAVVVVKLLKLLPFDILTDLLPPVLTDVCHILRSRAQESRDITRKTLAEISTILGPSCFGFILKELRGALARGYQLHVLSYTVHSILVETASIFKPGDLDYCMSQIVMVIMDDIFGVTGQEKDAEDYVSKMKEVKSSKSFDSMELISMTATIQRLPDLIKPLQSLLKEKLNLKMVKKIDELLRRIGVGLLRNNAVHGRDLLVFCYEIIQETYSVDARSGKNKSQDQYRTERYLINLKGARYNENRGSTTSYAYKLARLAMDILRTVLHKNEALQTTSNLAGFIPLIGDALIQSQEEIQISAVRLLTTIIKVPLPSLDHDGPVYVAQAISFIKGCPSTNAELAQASLKLISAILRERRNVEIKETSLAYLLKRLKPDLEEPDRQGVTFNFLKAIMMRKIVITEVYEVLDTVAAIMVTNHTRAVRDLARGAYFQFLMEYPQGKQRLAKQLAFLVKNLDYKHPEGRQSVLEVIHLLLSKVGNNLISEITGTFFIPLVMRLVNDDSADCREMAGVLIKEVFECAEREKTQNFVSLLRTWLNQDRQVLLTRLALQCYCIYCDVHGEKSNKELVFLQEHLLHILKSNTMMDTADWELLYFALQTLAKVSQIFPSDVFTASWDMHWAAVRSCLSFPHAWVKLSAARLVGLYFAEFAKSNTEKGFGSVPLVCSSGLKLDGDDMLQLTRQSSRMLRVPGISEELATQVVKNVVFLGKCLSASGLEWTSEQNGDVSVFSDADTDTDDEEPEHTNRESSPESPKKRAASKTALQFLLERISSTLRHETLATRPESLIPKTASLQLLGALCTSLPPTTLQPLLEVILLPLNNLTDPSIPTPSSSNHDFIEKYKTLVTTAEEVMGLLQTKVGTSEFVAALTRVREGVRERREGRKVKRRIEALAEPEKAQRDKRKKVERKKGRRKEKGQAERERRKGAAW